MTQSVDEKVASYVGEAMAYGQMMAKNTKPWSEIKKLYNNYYDRLEAEPEEVQFKVALAAVEMAEMAIEMYGNMGDMQFAMVSTLAESIMPSDTTVSKRGIEWTEKHAKGHISPRVAFHYNAVKKLPDDDPANTKKVLQIIRAAYDQPSF